ncbi:hypothetical protein Tco_0584425 [Tanacetum coccineum]
MANLPPNDDANAFVPNFNNEFMPNPGHAHFANNNNNNGWIEWDVPLGGMDELMVDPEFDEEDDEDEAGDVVDAPNPSIYEREARSVDEDRWREPVHHPQTALHESRTINQQLQTTVAEMQNREGTVIQYMLRMEERLTMLEKRLPGPPPEGQ